eukprot:TRINITY_DN6231_c0_g2_i1.p1 TRINITY_DN6231_c0_g2~~TRINITY_DN6231_c0_g2_i1.p1  ORF type:complete len:286 (-),score=40.05 TRINITY_DN6231_c0_g2_i1:44-901(-)
MLGGREKIGNASIDWKTVAFGSGKTRRKTFGFGKYNKKQDQYDLSINIRELSIVDAAGTGCGVWDAAIILSRWIFSHGEVFKGQRVLELGSGCGLCGLVASSFASETWLTDCSPKLLSNLEYEIDINSKNDEGEEDAAKGEVYKNTRIAYIDWDNVRSQDINGEGLYEEEVPKDLEVDKKFVVKIPPADIIVGSELTYTPISVVGLTKVIQTLLKPGGIFYELLSDDRDGVPAFLDVISKAGFEIAIYPVTDEYMGNFKTGQRPETYKFYSFKRKGEECRFPDMS